MDLKDRLEELATNSVETIEKSETIEAVEELRIQLLGKKGQLTELLKMMKDLDKA